MTFSSRQLQAFFSTAWAILLGLVTVRSSPTIWMSTPERNEVQVAQSSWSKGSSMETTDREWGQSRVKSLTALQRGRVWMGIVMVLRIGRTKLVAMETLKSVCWAAAGYLGKCTGTPGGLTRIVLNEALI